MAGVIINITATTVITDMAQAGVTQGMDMDRVMVMVQAGDIQVMPMAQHMVQLMAQDMEVVMRPMAGVHRQHQLQRQHQQNSVVKMGIHRDVIAH